MHILYYSKEKSEENLKVIQKHTERRQFKNYHYNVRGVVHREKVLKKKETFYWYSRKGASAAVAAGGTTKPRGKKKNYINMLLEGNSLLFSCFQWLCSNYVTHVHTHIFFMTQIMFR